MLKKSMKHAIDGLIFTYQTERNFRIHTVALFLVVIAGFFFNVTSTEWILLLLVSALVLFAECINTAVEHTLDWIEPNYDEVVKRVKDICAGAVLITAIGAAIIGFIIFLPYVYTFIISFL